METITYDIAEVQNIVAQNEALLMPKALGVILSSMESKDPRVALDAAKTALAMYGKDAPPKQAPSVNILAAFSDRTQLTNLFRGLGQAISLAANPETSVVDASVAEVLE